MAVPGIAPISPSAVNPRAIRKAMQGLKPEGQLQGNPGAITGPDPLHSIG